MRILLPLVHKSVDLIWLWQRGHEVVGVEDIDRTMTTFAKTSGLELSSDMNNNSETIRNFITAENTLRALQTNFTTANNPFHDHSFHSVWDRSGFASIPPQFRRFYAETMKRLLDWHSFRYLLLVYEYDDSVVKGPPYSVTEDQISDLFADCARISKIQERTMNLSSRTFPPNKFAESGTQVRELVYLLQNL